MADEAYAKIVLTTVCDDGTWVETPWTVALGDNRYRLSNVPFYAYGVSFDDVVEATPDPDDPRPHFRRVLVRSGNRTVRVIAEDGAEAVDQRVLDQAVALGCSYEGATRRYICINIPASVSLDQVVALLESTNIQWEQADPTYEALHPPD